MGAALMQYYEADAACKDTNCRCQSCKMYKEVNSTWFDFGMAVKQKEQLMEARHASELRHLR